jgi:hypothetical protein
MLIRTSNIDLPRMMIVFGALVVFWTSLVTILPSEVYDKVTVILTAIQSVLLYLMRSGKYVDYRTQDPK